MVGSGRNFVPVAASSLWVGFVALVGRERVAREFVDEWEFADVGPACECRDSKGRRGFREDERDVGANERGDVGPGERRYFRAVERRDVSSPGQYGPSEGIERGQSCKRP